MDRAPFDNFVEQSLAALPGWIFTLSGLLLVAVAILVPAWVEYRQLAWQADVMRAQAAQLAKEENSYRQFADALAHDDPVLIQRLAFYHLRLKPVGTRLIGQIPVAAARSDIRLPVGLALPTPAMPPWRSLPTLDDLLGQPIPHPPIQCAVDSVGDSRLIRITTGHSRYALFAAGLLCLYVGLLPKAEPEPGEPGHASAAPAAAPAPTIPNPSAPTAPASADAAASVADPAAAVVAAPGVAAVADPAEQVVTAELDDLPPPIPGATATPPPPAGSPA